MAEKFEIVHYLLAITDYRNSPIWNKFLISLSGSEIDPIKLLTDEFKTVTHKNKIKIDNLVYHITEFPDEESYMRFLLKYG